MKLSGSTDTHRVTGGIDPIMSVIHSTPYLQSVPVRRSVNVRMPTTSAYEPYPIPTSFRPDLCQRINVLRPDPPERRTVGLETEDRNTFNVHNKTEKERQLRERFHNAYSRYYYGDSIDKETYRKYIRESLKQQMMDREFHRSFHNRERLKESTQAVLRDHGDIEKDREASLRRSEFMRQFRDGNKMLMDETRRRRTDEIRQEQCAERKMLQFNPINWSATLK